MSAARKTLAASILAGTLATLASTAGAESVTAVTADALTERNAVVVSFEDLDLTSPKAQKTLYNRLSRAAEQVCGSQNRRIAGSFAQAARNGDCYEAALSKAMAKVSQNTVASTY